MNIRSEKGFSGMDLAISITVIFICITFISILSYNMNSEKKAMELKSQALQLCVKQIELMKQVNFTELEGKGITDKYVYTGNLLNSVSIPEGFTRTVTVEDYNHINNTAFADYLKKITVEISYKHKKKDEKIQLSTLVKKE